MTQWAYLTWFPEHGANLVHPEDISKLGSGVQGLLGTVSFAAEGWASFAFGEHIVRVQDNLPKSCAPPEFAYGQVVQSVPPRSHIQGPVRLILWHFKKGTPFFFIGSSHSRYSAYELRAV